MTNFRDFSVGCGALFKGSDRWPHFIPYRQAYHIICSRFVYEPIKSWVGTSIYNILYAQGANCQITWFIATNLRVSFVRHLLSKWISVGALSAYNWNASKQGRDGASDHFANGHWVRVCGLRGRAASSCQSYASCTPKIASEGEPPRRRG